MESESCPNLASSMAANSCAVAGALEVTSNKRQKTKAQKGEKNSVWSHFSRIYNDDGAESEFVACDYCKKNYTHKGANYGTSTLRNHLNRCKEYPLNCLVRNDQSTIPFAKVDPTPSIVKVDQDMLRKAYARMIIVDELPFRFGEGEGFRHFIGLACPMFRIMSRTTVARDCLELYKSEKRKLKKSLTSSNQRICLTTDQWTSIQNLSYMCVTAHYIDKDWKLNKKIISFNVLNSHKGVAIGGAVESCLKEWGVKSVFTLTVDNASSNDTAVLSLKKTLKKSALVLDGECFHVRCCAHIVNLIVRDGLKEVESSISNIRSAIRYIRSSPQRASKFKQYCEEEGLPSKCALVLDVATRWNYTYHMLKSALKFQRAFLLMELKEDLAKDLGDEVPSERDWDNARVLANFLQTFYEVTNKFSGSKYVISNIHFHEAHAVENLLIEWSGSEDPIMCAMTKKMKAKFDKYWSPFDKMNYLLLVAVVMDPRYKLIYIGFTYNEIYPSNKVENLVEKLNNLLKRLYAFYLESSPFYNDMNDVVNEPVQESTGHGEHVDGSLIDECLNEPTMGEKLANLNLVENNEVDALEKEENSEPAKPPSADSVHVLLKQALRADDRVLLLSCLCTRDEKVIANSVSLLKPSDILKLLQSLLSLMQSRGAVLVCCIPWIRSLLLQHASGIMSQESSLFALNSLYQLIESRVSTFQSALQMSSALDLFYAGAIDDDLEENDVITPVIFEDKDDSEEDESEDAMETDEEAGVGSGDAEPHSDVSEAEDGDFMAFDF